jgi:small subunit ribosomal protein S3
MGQKVNPIGLRIGITNSWRSKWFGKKEYKENLKQDFFARQAIMKEWKSAGIADVEIERSAKAIKFIIKTARPGVLIGRGGSGINDIQNFLRKKFIKDKKTELKIEIQEVKNPEENASILAQSIAEQLERRMPFRRVMKGALEQANKNPKIKGVRILLSGRLGGAEMSRKEWLAKGRLPLHTLRADIDFSRATAYTTYGTLGVKVWIYKGEKFIDKEKGDN